MPEQEVVIKSYRDIPPMAASLGTMRVNKTGSWRNVEPFYEDKLAPCQFNCPAGEDVLGYLSLIADGKFREGWELIRLMNPFPGVCGRVCPHPCEAECNRAELGGRINIRSQERFLADVNLGTEIPIKRERIDKKVAIVGSGPAGLSCAYQLALKGYGVTIFEALPQPGGMMRVGIPDYRLPKDVLNHEIDLIIRTGVEIKTGIRVGDDLSFDELRHKFDAVFVATGLHKSRSLGAEGEGAPGVVSGIEVLRKIGFGEKVELGKNIIVVGGGNTAMDVARSVLRMGSKPTIIYRRTRKEMPAIPEEVDDGLAEGIKIHFLTNPARVITENDRLTRLECVRMELGEPDESGRRRPVEIKGSNFTMDTDMVITAIGETAEVGFLAEQVQTKGWGIPATDFGVTGVDGIFAGGDVSTGAGTVTHAVGSGRRAAEAIHRYLCGQNPGQLKIEIPEKIVYFDDLNMAYFRSEPRAEQKFLEAEERIQHFGEVYSGISPGEAVREARRCFSCGRCTACDNCLIFCPDVAINRGEGDTKYEINYDYCKGCTVCVSECPRSSISIRAVH